MYRPTSGDEEDGVSTFGACPVCTRRTKTGGTFKIMDLATKGEQPFANLVREQFVNQVASKPLDELHPNEGRKALLFSDGRQKAARLARDLPREVERDSMREALVCAVAALRESNADVGADETLYAGFVSVCARHHLHFFDGTDGRALIEECQRFARDYELDLSLALEDGWKPTPPMRYRQAVLRQISDPYYSLVAACAVSVEARKSKLRLLEKRLSGKIPSHVEIAEVWIQEMIGANAFDPGLSYTGRLQEFPFFTPIRQEDGLKGFFEQVASRASLDADQLSLLRTELFDLFTRPSIGVDDSGRLLATDGVVLRIAIDETWLQCQFCGHLQLKPFLGACVVCGKKDLEPRPPDHPYMTARKGFFREPLRAVLRGGRPVHITAEEHTAQLSQRDAGVVYATTEEFELRFQDVPLGNDKPPVDVLSCTTTMEVGIDIGSLTAVGLRTVPPLRENYQQRAGRAGRRGTSVSSVVTFAQGGAHDAHYFANPQTMISGDAREPRIKSDNKRLARRHVYSYLLQTFFHGQMDKLPAAEQRKLEAKRPDLMSAFGAASDFFAEDGDFTFGALETWLSKDQKPVTRVISSWLPKELFDNQAEAEAFVRGLIQNLLRELKALGVKIAAKEAEQEEHEGEQVKEVVTLLDLLFDEGLLPSYAFPTDLSSFVIQEHGDHGDIIVKERPQLAKAQALSEYAPGRLLVVNKLTYRVGGIFFDGLHTATPAQDSFKGLRTRYIGCKRCSYVRLDETTDFDAALKDPNCPVCGKELDANEL
ncbi:MAG: hypothetical protein JST16_01845, partial [Bdellovibrionales bacterium]|nr:hypothetical protein [Bdellovibrionales bacterium]